jgi:hypothetical protein
MGHIAICLDSLKQTNKISFFLLFVCIVSLKVRIFNLKINNQKVTKKSKYISTALIREVVAIIVLLKAF